jgi:multiple antibiotic resistance protein
MPHNLSFQLMLVGIFAVANNFKSLGKFLQLTQGLSRKKQLQLSSRASLASLCIMMVALFCGDSVLRFFGVSLDSFRIAGGLILAILGIDMIHAKRNSDDDELIPSSANHHYSTIISTAIIPIAIPLTTGAGTFSTIIIFVDAIGGNNWLYYQLIIAILSQTLINYLVFRYSSTLLKLMGRTGMNVLIRLVGLITLSLGVQFITQGLKAIFPGLGI